MAIGAFLPLVAFVVIAGGVGLRLTKLWRRTGGVPEGSLGIGLLIVTGSMPLSAVGRIPAIAMQPAGRLCFAAGLILAAVGLCSMSWFNRDVFRREQGWAGWLIALIGAGLLGSVLYMSAANWRGQDVQAIQVAMRPGTVTLLLTVSGCFVWGAVESFLCHAAARRRLELGLSDPVLVNRFLVWGLANVAGAVQLAALTACVLAGMVIMREPIPLFVLASTGVVTSVCWYITFFTPERYRRFVLRNAR